MADLKCTPANDLNVFSAGSARTVTVRMVEFGDGPRHLRLRKIWRAIAACTPGIQLETDPEKHPSHESAFNKLWRLDCQSRFLVLTEEDFLPNLETDWTHTGRLLGSADLVACEYRMRTPLRVLQNPKGIVGGWYLAFDLDSRWTQDLPKGPCGGGGPVCPPKRKFDFGGKDCGNRLQKQIPPARVRLIAGRDGYLEPEPHYGIEYYHGVHLFWSRHLHDDPSIRIGGIPLDEIQKWHDRRVDQWLADAPSRFHEHYKE